jgi:hypothetical protein
MSAAKIKNLQWLTEFLRTLVNGTQIKVPGDCLAAHWDLLETVRREYQELEPGIICWLSNCEIS